MNLIKYLYPRADIRRKIRDIEDGIAEIVKQKCTEKFNITWYGAYDIDPKHLVYWICVKSDILKNKFRDDTSLNQQLRILLERYNYPVEARQFVHIDFESQETVDRESNGNWYRHWL